MHPQAELFVSVDLDDVRHHLSGYGVEADATPRSLAIDRALPRYLELFAALGLRASFFVVAEDAARHAPELRAAIAGGHEIASHSFTHPVPFTGVRGEALRRETAAARAAIEQAVGVRVDGFRSPGFGLAPAVLDAVAAAGYSYDASLLPTPAAIAFAARLYGMNAGPLGATVRYAFAPRRPRRLAGGLWEAPVSTLRLLRLPMYHTLCLFLGARRFAALARFLRGEAYVHYVMHAIDLLGRDEVDARLHRHPGGAATLAEKTATADQILRLLAAGRRSLRLSDRFVAGSSS